MRTSSAANSSASPTSNSPGHSVPRMPVLPGMRDASINEWIEALAWMETLPVDHVVPGHDPLVRARYPAEDPRFEGIVHRLDIEPKAVP